MNQIRLLCSIAAVALFTACTTVTKVADSRLAPPERRLALQTPVDGGASITVLRDNAFAAGGATYLFWVDGLLAARLETGEYVVFYVPAGEHLLEVRTRWEAISIVGDSNSFRADPGAKYYFRINTGADIRLLRTSAESADPAP